jgi:hypothetical protein
VRSRAFDVSIVLFLMMAAFILAKTGRDAMFFQKDGLLDLPRASMAIAVLSLPMALATLALMQIAGPRPARIVTPLLMAGFLATYAFLARPGAGGFMTTAYVIIPLAFGVIFSQAWLLGADLFEGASREEVAHAYSWIGAASILGGVAGGAIAKLAAPHWDPHVLVIFAAAMLVAASIFVGKAQARNPLRYLQPGETAAAPRFEDFRRVLQNRYSFLLLAVAMSAALAGTLVEFQFYITASAAKQSGRQNADFFASFYLVLNAIAFLGQIYLMPRVQRAIGVMGSLFILPAALLGLAGALFVNASILLRSTLRVTEGGLKSSIHRSNWEQAYLALGRAERSAAKLIVDGMGARLAEGAAAVILFLWIRSAMPDGHMPEPGIQWITWVLVIAALTWITLTVFLRRSAAPAIAPALLESEARLDIPIPDS